MPSITGIPDAVSDVLSLVRMRGGMVCANEYPARWSFSFHKSVGHFHIVERGAAWIHLDGRKPVRIETGDLVLLPLGAGHTLCSDPKLKATPIEKAIARLGKRQGTVLTMGSGAITTQVVCGQFSFDGVLASKLLTVLPTLIHIAARDGKALEWLKLTTHFLVEETRNPRPGSAIMVERLLDLLFIQAIREWGSSNPNNLGWMSGLRDDRIGKALSAIHAEPTQAWTVEALADVAGMSRSSFAVHFLDIVGQTPLKYLTSWRLNLGVISVSVQFGAVSEFNHENQPPIRTTLAKLRPNTGIV